MKSLIENILKKLFRLNTDFKELFFLKESQTLSGEKNARLLWLTIMLLVTFIAIGFAVGSLNYLKEAMDNPFTNWVDMAIKGSEKDKVKNLVDFFEENPKEKGTFGIANITGYETFHLRFRSVDFKTSDKKGRTITTDKDKIYKKVIDEKSDNLINLIERKGVTNYNGIIVTKKMLDKLGYKSLKGISKIPIVLEDPVMKKMIIYLDLIAIVKQLPNDSDFICFPNTYNYTVKPFTTTHYIETDARNTFSFLHPENKREEIEKIVKGLYSEYDDLEVVGYVSDKKEKVYKYTVFFSGSESWFLPDEIKNKFDQLKIKVKGVELFTDVNLQEELQELDSKSHIAFNFNELDKIRKFSEFTDTDYKLSISMAQVEAKENFALTSNLTLIISITLFGFSLLSVILYLLNVLRAHLKDIKTNLGTFTAFGLRISFLTNTYISIVLVFLIVAISISLLISAIIGYLFINHFSLMNIWVLLSILVLILICSYATKKSVNELLKKTPGDLIYNR